MTEAEWLACDDPEGLWQHLEGRHALSPRKRRLFAVAAARLVAEWFIDPVQAAALDVAERYADGSAPAHELAEADRPVTEIANKLFWTCESRDVSKGLSPEEFEGLGIPRTGGNDRLAALCGLWAATNAASATLATQAELTDLGPLIDEVAKSAASARLLATFGDVDPDDDPDYAAEYESGRESMRGRLAALLRDVAGNPYRAAVPDPAWVTATVLAVAEGIYASGDFSALPVLSDALEEAGCTDAELLSHLRSPGPHVRGCWALDLVRGKE
jgi:hypothetical protein